MEKIDERRPVPSDEAATIARAAAAMAGPPAAAAEVESPRRSPKAERREAQRLAEADPDAVRRAFETGAYPYDDRLTERAFVREMQALQVELLKAQGLDQGRRQRVVILFEGRDAAGKGGTIKRFMEHLNPRGARVVALEKPSSARRRSGISSATCTICRPPARIVFFDRSWYNRAGVERVMGFCTPAEYLEFMRQGARRADARALGPAPLQYWFSVTREEQGRRFRARETDPLKQWKLSPIDLASLDKWDGYTEAKEAMFFYTDTADAPWVIVKSDDKKRARLNCLQHFLSSLDYPNKDRSVVTGADRSSWGRPGMW